VRWFVVAVALVLCLFVCLPSPCEIFADIFQ
jgi:hypothetical protein